MTGSLRAMILSLASDQRWSVSIGWNALTASMMSSRLVTPASGTAISASSRRRRSGDGSCGPGAESGRRSGEHHRRDRVVSALGLTKRALDHLQNALNQNAELKPVRERLIKLYESVREYKSAIAELRVLLGQCSDVQEEVRYLREILRLDDRDQSAQRRLKVITGTHRIDLASFDEPDEPEIR